MAQVDATSAIALDGVVVESGALPKQPRAVRPAGTRTGDRRPFRVPMRGGSAHVVRS